MRTFLTLAALLIVPMLTPTASAQCCFIPPPMAPDMCGMGYYAANPFGVVYGPNYNVRPPFPPFQGMILGPCRPGGAMGAMGSAGAAMAPAFGTHPWARSPRDFFMIDTDPLQSPYSYGATSTGSAAYYYGATFSATNGAAGNGVPPVPLPPPVGGPAGRP